ncbi:MAG: hypothetical protein JW814_01410 [Candidatus Krumholzibacteriota bacterium]|nr:hypothetical protein [Candidatus Krumholzibacteriota bacterium]
MGVFILLVNVCYLYFMENTYRAANIQGKVTLKYPMLGMLTASLLNFVVMSRLLSLSSVDRRFLIVETCGIIIVAVTFLYANIRYNFFEIGIPAKKENNSTITVMIAGLYFISIGLISWISALAGLPYDRFHLYVIGIFIAFLLLSIGISGRVRRRLRIFLNDNFYLENYNYRREWRHFSRLMATSLRIEDFLSNTIGSLCETVMVQRGIIWVDIRNGKEASYGATGEDWTPETPGWLLSLCRDGRFEGLNRRFNRKIPSLAERSGEEESDHIPCWIRFIAPLGHGEETKGFIALGVKDTGAPFGQEDETFLETIADQALITIDNLLMEERFLESKQIESFNRFASFVIHDLKNTVGMLSLTAENARENMDDKEFQKDTIQTIKRSVEKMQDLINSLNAHKYPGNISRTRTEIVSLVRDKAAHLMPAAQNRKISLDFSPPGELYAHVDRSAIERIIENLILNSVDATGENGKITITISVDDREGITLTVADTGKGFDAEYLKNDLFKPFSSTKKNGLGIGLALCKSMIEAHGGSISINNLGGNGAVVSIKIPGIDSN